MSKGTDNAEKKIIDSKTIDTKDTTTIDTKDTTTKDTTTKDTTTKDTTTIDPKETAVTTVAEPKKGGYSFVGGNIFKVTQEAGKGTCVIPSDATEVKNDTDFTKMMKNTLGMVAGGSKSANKKNKTNKKKGGKKHKKSMKHKKAAKKC